MCLLKFDLLNFFFHMFIIAETKQNQVAKRPLGLKKNIKCVEHVRQDVDHTPSKSLTDGQLPAKTNQVTYLY